MYLSRIQRVNEGEKLKQTFFNFSTLSIPGRFQVVDENIILDVAHNPPAIEATIKHAESLYGRVNILFGAMKDKNVEEIYNIIDSAVSKIYLIHLDNNGERGADIPELVKRAPENMKNKLMYCINDEATIKRALKNSSMTKLLVTGSFFTLEKFLNFYESYKKDEE